MNRKEWVEETEKRNQECEISITGTEHKIQTKMKHALPMITAVEIYEDLKNKGMLRTEDILHIADILKILAITH